jgi:hypothetical protein
MLRDRKDRERERDTVRERERDRVRVREGVTDRDGERVTDRDGERVTVRDGERVTDRDGERVTVRDGERVTDRDGERVTVRDGERVTLRETPVRPEDLDAPRWPSTTSDTKRRVRGTAIQDVVLIIGAAPSEAVWTFSAIAIPPHSTRKSFEDKALRALRADGQGLSTTPCPFEDTRCERVGEDRHPRRHDAAG